MKQKLLIFIALLGIGFTSCDLGDDPAIGGTATQAVSGEYFVQLFSAPGGALFVDYTMMTVSNTAANVDNRVRISDDGHIWNFTGEFDLNLAAQTFSGDRVPNAFFDKPDPTAFDPIGTLVTVESDYPKYMTITNGAVYSNAATVPSAAPSDSIAFTATGFYYIDTYRVVAHVFGDTISTDPLEIETFNVYQFVEEMLDLEDGPYFLSGYQRTGFLEDEH